MIFTYSKKPKKLGLTSYRVLTMLDGGCTSSIVPTQLAEEWGIEIDRERNDITLLMADGSKMATDGIARLDYPLQLQGEITGTGTLTI